MNIATEIKNQRTALGLTQEQLAEKILVSSKTISNWETGKTTPDIDNLIRLKNILNLSLDNLLLEGSDLVENIKKYAQLKRTRFYSILSYIILSILISISIFGSSSSTFSIILDTAFTCIAIMSSLILTVTLLLQSTALEKELSAEEKSIDKKQSRTFNVVIFILAILTISIVVFSIIYSFSR